MQLAAGPVFPVHCSSGKEAGSGPSEWRGTGPTEQRQQHLVSLSPDATEIRSTRGDLTEAEEVQDCLHICEINSCEINS